jgi:hypothetical protein
MKLKFPSAYKLSPADRAVAALAVIATSTLWNNINASIKTTLKINLQNTFEKQSGHFGIGGDATATAYIIKNLISFIINKCICGRDFAYVVQGHSAGAIADFPGCNGIKVETMFTI